MAINMVNLEDAYHQRIHTIVTSFDLTGYDPESFDLFLNSLKGQVPLLLLELALVETLVKEWLRIPFERGVTFLEATQDLLQLWQKGRFECRLTPLHFELITGLDPTPTFTGLDQVLQDWISAADRVRATVQMPATEMP